MAIFFFFQAEDGIRDVAVTGVQTCALPIFAVVPVSRTPSASCAANPANANPALRPHSAQNGHTAWEIAILIQATKEGISRARLGTSIALGGEEGERLGGGVFVSSARPRSSLQTRCLLERQNPLSHRAQPSRLRLVAYLSGAKDG